MHRARTQLPPHPDCPGRVLCTRVYTRAYTHIPHQLRAQLLENEGGGTVRHNSNSSLNLLILPKALGRGPAESAGAWEGGGVGDWDLRAPAGAGNPGTSPAGTDLSGPQWPFLEQEIRASSQVGRAVLLHPMGVLGDNLLRRVRHMPCCLAWNHPE